MTLVKPVKLHFFLAAHEGGRFPQADSEACVLTLTELKLVLLTNYQQRSNV